VPQVIPTTFAQPETWQPQHNNTKEKTIEAARRLRTSFITTRTLAAGTPPKEILLVSKTLLSVAYTSVHFMLSCPKVRASYKILMVPVSVRRERNGDPALGPLAEPSEEQR
jgi:hypothetical protein